LKLEITILLLFLGAFFFASLLFASIPTHSNYQSPRIFLESGQSSLSNSTIVAMPSYNFSLNGHVLTQTGAAVANGTVQINAFDTLYYVNTDSNGVFGLTLTVPPSTPDGLYKVTVAFEASGSFGPSSTFALVNVVHKLLNFTLYTPAVVVTGLGASVSGNIQSNGSALPGCAVSVALPWGIFYGTTDSSGNYKVPVSVPLTQFSLEAEAIVSANPTQPYIETVQTTRSIGIFNPIEVIVPAIIIDALIYEARNLELVSRKRVASTVNFFGNQLESIYKRRPSETSERQSRGRRNSKILTIYRESIDLANKKFQTRLGESLTTRQAINEISKLDKGGSGAQAFSEIAKITEDFAYAETFDETRIKDAEKSLGDLKVAWMTRKEDAT
jgi:hypothetical protein